MHVALCHDAMIPPPKYGGTERIVYWLARALEKLGHRVTLIAREGSHADGARVVACRPGADWDELVPPDVDILHLWSTPRKPPRRPFVVTIEGNGQPGETFHPNTLFISRKHAENHGASHFVYNGIDVDAYDCQAERGDYLVFLAKASWSVKNLEGAAAVARAAGLRLEVLGSRDWPLRLQRHLPRLGRARYWGMVGDAEKRPLLARARGLLFPVRWHEPFGIAITEALASGCPVYGTPYGSLPELVTPDVGVLSADGATLVAALREKGRFSAERCRSRVKRGLTDVDMAQSYLHYYEHVLRSGHLGDNSVDNPPRVPENAVGLSSKSLLPWTSP